MEARENARDRLLRIVHGEFGVRRGHPLPYGATARREGVNFSVYSKHASELSLVLFVPGEAEPVLELPLDRRYNKTGDVWHVLVCGLDPGIEYGFRAAGPEAASAGALPMRFDSRRILIDPYSKSVAGLERWGEGTGAEGRLGRLRSRVIDEEFDWGHEHPLAVPLADSIIYELHVRGFTRHASSGVAHAGTYRGLVEKIPYLKQLGVTAVELMPVTEFEECDNPRSNLLTGEPLRNFWGYQPVSFFAPKAAYASSSGPPDAVREFKSMVKSFHEAGIEVILDIVFNHTGEGDERGATFCWRGLDDPTYYLLDAKTGRYLNYSGCGNTLNCNHPVVRHQILAALRYWVTEMHVDGFRFDLASILGRGRDGEVLPNPPLIEAIAADPVMAGVKLIAEAWDAAGLYQVGSFPSWGRWAEWNGRFRDELRRFVKSDPGLTRVLATRLVRQPRPLPRLRPRALALDQLRDQPRRLHARRPGVVRRQAQLGERRGQHRRPSRQPVVELRCRGTVRAPRGGRAARAPAAELPGAPVPVAGRSDAARGRRARPHPGRQQQRLLPGQRDLVARLVAGRGERRSLSLHAAARPLPQGARLAAPPQLLRGRGASCGGVARHQARQARLDAGGAHARDAPPSGGERRGDLPRRERPLGAASLRAAAAAAGPGVAPLPRHQPAAGRGRARARQRGPSSLGAQLRRSARGRSWCWWGASSAARRLAASPRTRGARPTRGGGSS